MSEAFVEAFHRNPFVRLMWEQGYTLEQMVVELAKMQGQQTNRIVHLLSLAQMKLRGEGGIVYYQKPLPVELIPFSDEYPIVAREDVKPGDLNTAEMG